MLNNNPTISNTYTYNRRFEQFEVTCKGGIARHHEVFINYGSYGTTDTLLAYGNVPQFEAWGQYYELESSCGMTDLSLLKRLL